MPTTVIAGLVPAIRLVSLLTKARKAWMPGTRPGMTECVAAGVPTVGRYFASTT